jgi:hypothetical protein
LRRVAASACLLALPSGRICSDEDVAGAGFDCHLVKPGDSRELIELLGGMCSSSSRPSSPNG